MFSFLRKYGDSEDPAFRSTPVETNPLPDEEQDPNIAGTVAEENMKQSGMGFPNV
jgi:hypothetical protein